MAEVLEFLRLSSEHSTVELATAKDNPARKLGFAFVNVPVDSVEEVLQCNGTTLGGRNIKGQEFAVYMDVKSTQKLPDPHRFGQNLVLTEQLLKIHP